MAGPLLGQQGFDNPPEELRRVAGELSYQWCKMIHNSLFGTGSGGTLDESNIVGNLEDTVDHQLFQGILPYQHHGHGLHSEIDQAASMDAVGTTPVTVTSAPAGAAYNAAVQALINELRTDLTTTAQNVAALASSLNELITKMKSAGLMRD